VLVRLDHVACFIVNEKHRIMWAAVKLRVSDSATDCGKGRRVVKTDQGEREVGIIQQLRGIMATKRDLEIIQKLIGSLQTKTKKRKNIKVRDLKPVKDAKGGGTQAPKGSH
jgi:capsule polysaccharide export protein KpsE/RkpR